MDIRLRLGSTTGAIAVGSPTMHRAAVRAGRGRFQQATSVSRPLGFAPGALIIPDTRYAHSVAPARNSPDIDLMCHRAAIIACHDRRPRP